MRRRRGVMCGSLIRAYLAIPKQTFYIQCIGGLIAARRKSSPRVGATSEFPFAPIPVAFVLKQPCGIQINAGEIDGERRV
jgi:hypothetical protein